MKFVRWALAPLVFGLALAGSSLPAAAEITGSSGCQGSGTWQQAGFSIDAATSVGVVTIPRKDTVDWQGSVLAPPGVYSGSVWVELPPPFGELQIDSWSGDSQTTSNSGRHDYSLPKLVPAGVVFTVAGEHTDGNGTCSGSVDVQIEGGAFSSPLTAVSLVGTAATAAGLGALLRPLFRRAVS